jgi:cold-inducible RNA-binding protein
MSKKIFVGGLDWNTNDQNLNDAFGQFGVVTEAKVIMDRETGRSRGFGFVTFQDGADGDSAVAEMDGKMLDGRTVRVNVAQEKSGGGGGGGGGRGGFDRSRARY